MYDKRRDWLAKREWEKENAEDKRCTETAAWRAF
jgi:hypothetical protein